MSHLLLPPNSTALERAVADVAGHATFANAHLPITGIKLDNPPDEWLDFLIYEWGLSEFLPYFDDKRTLINSALHFNRIRGTKKAVHMALSWGNLSADIIEYEPSESMADLAQSWMRLSHKPYLHFGEFDLVIADDFSNTEITRAIELTNLAKPLRSRLTRLVGGYDRRKFVLDDTHLSYGYLSDDSGVLINQDDLAYPLDMSLPKLSLQYRHATHTEPPPVHVQTSCTIHFCHAVYSWRADMPYLDDLPDPIEVLMISSGGGATLAPIVYVGQTWADQPWATSSWDKTRELVMTRHQLAID